VKKIAIISQQGRVNHEFIALLTALFGYLILQFCETRILIFAKF
jgi:hypothetical protein